MFFDIQLFVWNHAMLSGSEPQLGRTSLCGTYAMSAVDKVNQISDMSRLPNTRQVQEYYPNTSF